MSDSEITVSAQTLMFHIQRFQELGGVLPEGTILGRWDLALELLENSDRRFPFTLVSTSVEFASQQLQDPVLGLNAVDSDRLPYSDVFELLSKNACTLEEYIRLLSRYFCLSTEIGVIEVHHKKPVSQVLFCPRDRRITSYHQMDGALLMAAKVIRQYAGIKPLAVTVDHECPPGCESVYTRKFGGEVRFAQNRCALDYDLEEMTRMRRAVERQLITPVLEQRRDELYGNDVIEKSEFMIRRLLIRGEPKREHIARELALSLRSYQRLLSSHNTTFKDLLENARKRMAREYLQQSSFTVQEIALLLGYSETSQFYKAFRRWFNRSPGEFRNSNGQPG